MRDLQFFQRGTLDILLNNAGVYEALRRRGMDGRDGPIVWSGHDDAEWSLPVSDVAEDPKIPFFILKTEDCR
jgi:hypothetical protein